MKIKHVQKTTLIDYPSKIACTIFLFGCNFRCPFCHNPELVIKEETPDIEKEKVLDFLEKRKEYLEGVCFTGGEPLLTLEESFLKKIKDMGYLVKMDTNGTFPDKLKDFIDKGFIDFVSMDIKSDRDSYSRFSGVDTDMGKIEKSIKTIIGSGLDYEFRTTILQRWHDTDKVEKMVDWLTGFGKIKKFVFQAFRNSGKLIDENLDEPDTTEKYLNELKEIASDKIDNIQVRF